MKPIIIVGASQFADLARFYLEQDAGRKVVGFAVDAEYLRDSTFGGLPVIPFETVEREFTPKDHDMFVAIGPHSVNRARAEKVDAASAKGFALASYISSKASYWPNLQYGPNTLVTDGTTIMPFVRLGRNVALICCNIGHHSVIEDHCMISGATVAGGVTILERTFVGMNATVGQQIRIGKRNVIGAGSLVLKSTSDDSVFAERPSAKSPVPSHRLRLM